MWHKLWILKVRFFFNSIIIIAYFTHQIKHKRLKRRLLISVGLLIAVFSLKGQDIDHTRYIQIDGLTLDESGAIVPNVGIYSFKLQRGAASDTRGIFSIISTPGDTVFFTLPGYRPTLLTIPQTLGAISYITDVRIVKDTITIEEVVVLPWKTYTEFKKAVVQARIKSQETQNMEINLALVKQQLNDDLILTPGQGYRYTMQQMSDNLYSRSQSPVNNLLNPFAWGKFINGIKHGLLKNNDHYKRNRPYNKPKVRKKKINN